MGHSVMTQLCGWPGARQARWPAQLVRTTTLSFLTLSTAGS